MGFFEDLSKKVSDATNSAKETTSKMAKESKLKKSISENESKINNMYSEVGRKVLEQKGNNEQVANTLEEYAGKIQALKDEIVSFRNEILLLNNKKRCPKCNAEVDSTSAFCPTCGADLKVDTEVVEEKVNEEQSAESLEKASEEIATETKEEVVEAEVATEEKEEAKEEKLPDGKIKCPGCNEIIEDKYTFCPKCGAKTKES